MSPSKVLCIKRADFIAFHCNPKSCQKGGEKQPKLLLLEQEGSAVGDNPSKNTIIGKKRKTKN